MRLWSLHPRYLDRQGLLAVWREALLAKRVLEGRTRGYKNHPQLERFKALSDPVGAVDRYLLAVWEEAVARGYAFDRTKIGKIDEGVRVSVTEGQVEYEWKHLLEKLKVRDSKKFTEIRKVVSVKVHPLFRLLKGEVEVWEKRSLPKS